MGFTLTGKEFGRVKEKKTKNKSSYTDSEIKSFYLSHKSELGPVAPWPFQLMAIGRGNISLKFLQKCLSDFF